MSDYVARIAPQVRRLVPEIGRLLDVGAGGGQLGALLQDRAFPWTAIEPSPVMRARLAGLHVPPRIVPAGWQDADVAPGALGFEPGLAQTLEHRGLGIM